MFTAGNDEVCDDSVGDKLGLTSSSTMDCCDSTVIAPRSRGGDRVDAAATVRSAEVRRVNGDGDAPLVRRQQLAPISLRLTRLPTWTARLAAGVGERWLYVMWGSRSVWYRG